MTISEAKDQLFEAIKSIPGVNGAGVAGNAIEVSVATKEAFEQVLTSGAIIIQSAGPKTGYKYQGFPVNIVQAAIQNTNGAAANGVATGMSKFKTTVAEKTFIITGAEVLMGIIEAIVLVNIINYFRKLPLRLPGWMEIGKITLLLTLTGMIGGVLSASIIQRVEAAEAPEPEPDKKTPFTGNSLSKPYRIPPVPVQWMVPGVHQLPKSLTT